MASTRSRTSAVSAGLGSQEPRLRQVPDYVSTAGDDAIECARLAGLHLDPWEELVLRDGLGERADGKWAAFRVGIEAPRQNGKGSILEARELAGAFVFEEKLIVHSAHEQITSSEHFRRLLNLIEGVPEFDRRVLKVVRGKGSEAIELRGDRRIMFKTRTAAGGRGLTGDCVVLDEAMILMMSIMGVLVPLMAARSMQFNPQLWYAGSAVDQQKYEHGLVFANLRRDALAGKDRLAYFGWSADIVGWLQSRSLKFDEGRAELDQVTPAMLLDQGLRSDANPGLGIRISPEHLDQEMDALSVRDFACERLGLVDLPDDLGADERVISAEAWSDCADADGAMTEDAVKTFAADVSPDRTWGSISVAGVRSDRLQHIELVDHERGTGWLLSQDAETEEWRGRLMELHTNHPGCRFAVDARGPASWLIQPMKDAGLEVIELSTQDYAQACGGFFDAAIQKRFRHIEQAELDEALASAKTAPLGEAWKWSRRHSTGADITPLVACTLALWGSETQQVDKRVPLVAWR